MTRATIGIVIGTSAVKVAVVSLEGAVLAEASRPYPTHTPHNTDVGDALMGA